MAWASEDTVWRPVQLEGLAMALVAVCCLFGILTTIVVGLRVYIRWKTRQFATDDWVIAAGYLFNVGQMIIAGYGGYTGLGTPDNKLTLAQSIEGYKSIIIWQTFYSFSLVFIKSSICVTLLRITREKTFKFILKLLIALSAGLSGVGLIVIFNQCHPMDRYWDKRVDGTCWPPIVATVLTYAASVFNVITDLTVATLPFFILKDVQMRPKLKLYIRLILALGLLAGVASIIRVPFTGAYMRDGDILYHVGHIVLWTIVECGLGIIAASLPMLRALFKRLAKDDSTNHSYRNDKKSGMNGTDLITIGGHYKGGGRHGGASRHAGYDTEVQVTVVGGPDNDSSSDLERGSSGHGHGDGDSTRHIIRVTRDIQQNSNPVDYYGSPHAADSLPRYHVNVGVGRTDLPPAPPVYSGRPQGMDSYFSR